jgi:hypothetical protein
MAGDWYEQGRPMMPGDAPTAHGTTHNPAGGSDKFSLVVAALLGNPIAASANRIVTSVNLTNVSFSIAAQPDVPRNLTCTVTDTTASITAGTITFTGTDPSGAAVVEVLDLSAALTLTGTKIFASVTSVVCAGATVLGGSGDETIVVGVGTVIGLPSNIAAVGAVKNVYLGGVRASSPTITAGAQTSGVDASSGTYANTKNLLVFYDVGG